MKRDSISYSCIEVKSLKHKQITKETPMESIQDFVPEIQKRISNFRYCVLDGGDGSDSDGAIGSCKGWKQEGG